MANHDYQPDWKEKYLEKLVKHTSQYVCDDIFRDD
jgi:hypothetical protein